MKARSRRQRRRKGLLVEWAGESAWRRLVAWLVQTAVLAGLLLVVFLVVMNVLLPNLVDNLVDQFQNNLR